MFAHKTLSTNKCKSDVLALTTASDDLLLFDQKRLDKLLLDEQSSTVLYSPSTGKLLTGSRFFGINARRVAMARTQNSKQINFVPSDDVIEDLDRCENKTKIINEALKMYFSTESQRLDMFERVQKLENFQKRFMAYYARKDNEPHSEFCDCKTCIGNRKIFSASRIMTLDPEPQTGEKIIEIIQRGIEQAERMNAIVAFEGNNYRFRLTAQSNANEEYAKYMDEVGKREDNSVSVSFPNPWLHRK
jgi:hypothetical protein